MRYWKGRTWQVVEKIEWNPTVSNTPWKKGIIHAYIRWNKSENCLPVIQCQVTGIVLTAQNIKFIFENLSFFLENYFRVCEQILR